MLKGLDHVNISTRRLEETRRFFVEVFGFKVAPRPDFGIPGYWLEYGGRDMIHLVDMGDGKEPSKGSLDHFALAVQDHDAMRAHLDKLKIPYSEFAAPDGSRKQLIVQDPNGVTVELNWRPA